MINKDEIKKSLPHGSFIRIAKKAGVSKGAVSRYFKGLIKSSPTIEKAALEIAIEYQNSISLLKSKLQKITR